MRVRIHSERFSVGENKQTKTKTTTKTQHHNQTKTAKLIHTHTQQYNGTIRHPQSGCKKTQTNTVTVTRNVSK